MAAHSELNGCGPIPPGSAWENGELVHGRAKDGVYYECESHSEFYHGQFTMVQQFGTSCANQPLGITSDEVARLLIQQSSNTSASIAASAVARMTAEMVAQDGLDGLRIMKPARTCAALGEARVMKIQIMPAVVLDVYNSGAAAECGE
jgi:hypothetical protein